MARKSRRYRGYFKRKERTLDRVKIETQNDIRALSGRLHELYEQTRANSQGDYGSFEQLHPNYFDAVQKHCGRRACFLLCWLDDELIGFHLLMIGERELVAKYIGMDYAVARDLNLYFIIVNQYIRMAIARGLPRIRMGNTAYAVKLMYGGKLARHWIYFRHPNGIVDLVLRKLAPLIDYERNDPDLQKVRAEAASARSRSDQETGSLL